MNLINPEYELVHNWLLYIIVFGAAFAITLLLTPWARKVAIKLKAVDHPKARGVHKKALPRMGGLAIFIGFIVAMGIATFSMEDFRSLEFAGFVVGALIIVGLGMLDDVFNLPAKLKLFVQIVAALVVVFTGTQIDFIGWDLPDFIDYAAIPVTVLWIVGMINAVNFIDGVDGLAAGVSSIASVFLMILCILSGSPMAVIFAVSLAGSCLGFLPRNFSPADVIMGDTGSTFLGYVLAVSSIMGVYKSYALLSVAIVGFALALPIVDTVYVTVKRILRGKSPMVADRGHMHHQLIDRGMSHKQTVLIMYTASIFAGGLALLISLNDLRALIVGLVLLLVLVSVIYAYRKRLQKNGDDKDDNNKQI
ncbi:MAG: undecaprenyl/decaprenyl-phosphate alpha-N-acetylglucosaminyl 1-phosphate transferase [Defluviitaleaceae bacterium]|nr:undecaprenyl/decaprenyl-phosphate alpha-N-acetylglucosaminyl 1-phosphate transferase [Defluviitaleaceae bacterium]